MLFRVAFLNLVVFVVSALAGMRATANACDYSVLCPGTAVAYAPTFGSSGCTGQLLVAWVSSQTAYCYMTAYNNVLSCLKVWYAIDTWVQTNQANGTRYNDSDIQWDRFGCDSADCGTDDNNCYLDWGPSYICEVLSGNTYFTYAKFYSGGNLDPANRCGKGFTQVLQIQSSNGVSL